ncbi:hypothetical protein ALC62_05752 [Cyphomyrmex costatus]|uniref:Uncharacterized protein n=1 Tax=Cyphomyrmex costatus TaxID=456900 RepID=A0A195CRU3_9HYME|nr:hypothetical protein ALC62_05752 [Cyphomyrmex costatus]
MAYKPTFLKGLHIRPYHTIIQDERKQRFLGVKLSRGAMSRCYSRKPLGYPPRSQNGAERNRGKGVRGREEGAVFPSSRESLPN